MVIAQTNIIFSITHVLYVQTSQQSYQPDDDIESRVAVAQEATCMPDGMKCSSVFIHGGFTVPVSVYYIYFLIYTFHLAFNFVYICNEWHN